MMKFKTIFFALILSRTLLGNQNDHAHHWRNYIALSLSFNLQFNIKHSLIDSTINSLEIYNEIRTLCYDQNYGNCHGRLKGLCGSAEMPTDRLMDCVWNLQVPGNLCINVTIKKFPNGDPFVNDYFSLSVRDHNERGKGNGVNFHHNQEHSSIITNTSQSLVHLKILKLFSISQVQFHLKRSVKKSSITNHSQCS